MKNFINEDYGGFLIISPLSTTKKPLSMGFFSFLRAFFHCLYVNYMIVLVLFSF